MSYSPHDLLPCLHPKEQEFKKDKAFFYEKVIKYLVSDIVRIMHNGIPIDLNKVQELEIVVDEVLDKVTNTLDANNLIQKILNKKYESIYNKKKEEVNSKLKTIDDVKDIVFSYSNTIHRTYVINMYLRFNDLEDLVKDKWTIKDVKQLSLTNPSVFLDSFLSQQASPTNIYIEEGMKELILKKLEIHNKKRLSSLENIDNKIKFNPNSPVDKQLLYSTLGLSTEKVSKITSAPKIDREQLKLTLEEVNILLENLNE